jgi:hypothetical protein
MKEDLNLLGNELNYITAVFWARIAPLWYQLATGTRTRINIALPTLEIGRRSDGNSSHSAMLGHRIRIRYTQLLIHWRYLVIV